MNAGRLAQGVAVVNGLMVVAAIVLGFGTATLATFDARAVSAVVYSVLASLIIAWHSRHAVGWLFLIVGFSSTVGTLVAPLPELYTYITSRLLLGLLAWAGHLHWIPDFLIPITLVLQYFPDGRLPSPRWWPVAAAAVAGVGGMMLPAAFSPWPPELQGQFGVQNPFAIAGTEAFFTWLLNASILPLAIGTLGGLAAVLVRLRWVRGVERTQMKWLVYTAAAGISILLAAILLLGNGHVVVLIVFSSMPALMALAIGIAILRHRLFDIDLIIRRTLIYAVITAVLGLVYFGSVVVMESVLRALSNADSPLVIVVSTLLIAALFGPLRSRIQRVIDRRFYRRKYDAARTLAAFGAQARDETDLERLSARLLAVVDETMQPEGVGLWLRPADPLEGLPR